MKYRNLYILAAAIGISAPLALTSTSALAADLGGDCCADLEERVAELEATTVRKGNRKVSVKISGFVNWAVLAWDDGFEENTYVVNNGNASSRFRFTGDAKISSDWSAGYYIELETRDLTFSLNQGTDNAPGLVVRQSNMFIKSATYGSLRWGLASVVTDDINWQPTTGGTVFYEQGAFHYESAFMVRGTNGGLSTNATIGSFCGHVALSSTSCFDNNNRQNVIRYDSPTIAGFTFAASWGEDDFWDVGLKYKGTAGDFKLAGAIAYVEDVDTSNTTGGIEAQQFYLTGGIMHVPTGIWVDANYWTEEYDNVGANLPESEAFWIQVGIQQKLNPLGVTKFWGSYTEVEDGFIATSAKAGGTFNINLGGGALGNVTDSELTRWGVGITQHIDAAAMQLYLLYRHTELDVTTDASGALDVEDFDAVIAGGVIKF